MNHNLIIMNPTKFLWGKSRPRITKKKNKMVSRAKRHGNAHIRRYHLDAMMAPIVSITKRDYGTDEVHNDSSTQSFELPVSGNLSSVHCQAGRQVYLEFLGLPLVEYNPRTTGTYRNTWSLMELLSMAFRRNNWINSSTYSGLKQLDPDDSVIFNSVTLPNGNVTTSSNSMISTTNDFFAFARNEANDTLVDFNFCYMGGYQEHIFTNATNLPVHLEFREYAPRVPMGFDQYRRQVNTPSSQLYSFNGQPGTTINTVWSTGNPPVPLTLMIVSPGNTNWYLLGGSNTPAAGQVFTRTATTEPGQASSTGTYRIITQVATTTRKYPMMYMTMFLDLLRGLKTHNDTDVIPSHMNSDLNNIGLFDEIDDKGFKYRKGVMVDTDMRFKVSEKKVKTLYPGEKYSYKLVFPPFTGNSLQLFQAYQRGASTISTAMSYGTFGVSPAVMPLFTKGLQVRAIGSTAYLKPQTHNDWQSKSYYAYDNNNGAPGAQQNEGLDPGFNSDRPIKHHATHPVRLSHEVKEHHSIKCLPNFKSYHSFNTNYLANAGAATDILPTDVMEVIDPVENNMENVIGDAYSGV